MAVLENIVLFYVHEHISKTGITDLDRAKALI